MSIKLVKGYVIPQGSQMDYAGFSGLENMRMAAFRGSNPAALFDPVSQLNEFSASCCGGHRYGDATPSDVVTARGLAISRALQSGSANPVQIAPMLPAARVGMSMTEELAIVGGVGVAALVGLLWWKHHKAAK